MIDFVLWFIMNIVFFGYIIGCYFALGPTTSISSTFYKMAPKWKFLFPLYCLIYSWLGVSLSMTPYMFVGASCISFVGFAADFRENRFINLIHHIAAALAAILCSIPLLATPYLFISTVVFALLFFALKLIFDDNKYDYWLEVSVFIHVSLYLLFKTDAYLVMREIL